MHQAYFRDHFAFCSGFENSYPIITDRHGKDLRRDGMELSGHYQHWRQDLHLVADMGLHYLRYGPPYYRCHLGVRKYDWSFPDKTFALLHKLGIEPITDLCHFGLPDWMGGSFQNPDWPVFFAEYARAFAERYSWVRLYTPVNEILIAAQFSALNGWWNERKHDDKSYITALKHLCKANILAQKAILKVRPDALFIQSESSTYYHSATPEAQDPAALENEKRFMALDLCYGHAVQSHVYEYLCDNGMSPEEYSWFMQETPALWPNCIMGSDYYITNEKKVMDGAGRIESCGEVLGYYEITKQYFDRYHLPIFHTETNRKDESDAGRWLWKEWFNILRLRADGLPILGFTWFSFFDQTDWDVALREENHRINPLGLYDLHRKIRPVGEIYRQIIKDWTLALVSQPQYRQLWRTEKTVEQTQRTARVRPGTKHHPHQEKSPTPHRRKMTRNEGKDG
ncbi:MAG TPA: family 1 glycosylhydrolase [Tepidisphaeraceae bacterium]|jgi:beta-glucosidase/6-phospho-beta-glucosidase/beta-galactosidase